jgi:hypothetical protein
LPGFLIFAVASMSVVQVLIFMNRNEIAVAGTGI